MLCYRVTGSLNERATANERSAASGTDGRRRLFCEEEEEEDVEEYWSCRRYGACRRNEQSKCLRYAAAHIVRIRIQIFIWNVSLSLSEV